MFHEFLIENGMDVQLKADMSDVLGILDKDVGSFQYDGGSFKLTSFNGVPGSVWKMMVKFVDVGSEFREESDIGYIEVSKINDGQTNLLIPPRSAWDNNNGEREKQAHRFASFAGQLINSLQERHLTDLPGTLPVS
tara:strand:+ start:733 stop:1140 length:408 start_codon:yes stop_codon:yes gene_type:complete